MTSGSYRCMEREKPQVSCVLNESGCNSGDAVASSDGCCGGAHGSDGGVAHLPEGGYVPTVGRWGCEWPS